MGKASGPGDEVPGLPELLESAAVAVEASDAPAGQRAAAAAVLRGLRGSSDVNPRDPVSGLDAALVFACLDSLSPAERQEIEDAATAEIAPYSAEMRPDLRNRALRVAVARRVRARFRLPDLGLLPLF